MFQKLLIVAIGLGIGACAHHHDVRPGDDGIHTVVLSKEDQADERNGYRNAMSQAQDYCDQMKQKPFIVNENTKYVGTMNEDNFQAAKTATKAAQAAGGVLSVFGGRTESSVGNVALFGGSAARGIIGNGYNYELKFRCK